MSLNELTSWLLKEGIKDEVDVLTRRIVRPELDNLVDDPEDRALSIEWPRLLFAGSILARSESRADQETALRIATGAVIFANSQPIKDAGAVLLDKLSNFRAIALADYGCQTDWEGRLGFGLRMEVKRRQVEQSVLIESSGRWLHVNDFQQRFWESANSNSWLSALARPLPARHFSSCSGSLITCGRRRHGCACISHLRGRWSRRSRATWPGF